MSPLESWSVDSVSTVLVVFLSHLVPPNLLPSFSGELRLIFDCGTLHLLPLVAGYSVSGFSDDD